MTCVTVTPSCGGSGGGGGGGGRKVNDVLASEAAYEIT